MLPQLSGYYRHQLEKTLEEIARELTAGTCACGKVTSVKKELETFVETNPDAPVVGAVRERMKALERGLAIKEDCVGG